MSASVRISLKAARFLEAVYERGGDHNNLVTQELRAAIAKATRASATRKRLRKPREAKRQEKNEETAAIYAAVARRAGGTCEACSDVLLDCFAREPEMDHFFGRGKVRQSTANCWMLCRSCHRLKGANKPSAVAWLERFIAHCERYGFRLEADKARGKVASAKAKGGAR